MLEQADIVRHAVSALGNGGEDVQYPGVELAGIGLARDGKDLFKPEFRGDHAVHFVDLLPVAVEEVQEGGFRSGGPAASEELQFGEDPVQFFEIGHEILDPEGGSLSDCDELGGLIVGISEGREGPVLHGELREGLCRGEQFSPDMPQRLPVKDDIGVVGDVAAGGAEVDDPGGGGSGESVGVDMGHDVVADLPLPGVRGVEVDVVDIGLQFSDLLFGDRQAELRFRSRQRDPQASPRADALPGGKQAQHGFGGVAGGQGGFVPVSHGLCSLVGNPAVRIGRGLRTFRLFYQYFTLK